MLACLAGPREGIRLHSSTHHYNDVIMDTIASQITSLTIVYSTVYSDADQRKHQRSASLAFVRGNYQGPVDFPHKWPLTRKLFPFDDVIMMYLIRKLLSLRCVLSQLWCDNLMFTPVLQNNFSGTRSAVPLETNQLKRIYIYPSLEEIRNRKPLIWIRLETMAPQTHGATYVSIKCPETLILHGICITNTHAPNQKTPIFSTDHCLSFNLAFLLPCHKIYQHSMSCLDCLFIAISIDF